MSDLSEVLCFFVLFQLEEKFLFIELRLVFLVHHVQQLLSLLSKYETNSITQNNSIRQTSDDSVAFIKPPLYDSI
jgi:hypothetical protein